MKKWKKLGLVIDQSLFDWAVSGLITPTPLKLTNDIIRVYFGGRDHNKKSRIGYVDIDFKDNYKIINKSVKPIVELGSLGCFDDCGVLPSSVVIHQNKIYLYYSGVTLLHSNMFLPSTGLLISKNGEASFERYSQAPVLGRNHHDPYHSTGPFVLHEKDKWKMWYQSATNWIMDVKTNKPKHYYLIKYAESENGIDWVTNTKPCLNYSGEEYAITKPSVIFDKDIYLMWYCYRGGENTYRIGYAESQDGISWERKDKQVGIDVSNEGWDSEMICYPSVFDFNETRYMLYNVNGYGRTGFGLAMLEDD